ncbi:MAG: DUF3991 domain-containing protein, partial [Hydrogenoanaerobacterium sp.]
LNGINNTHGTWQKASIHFDKQPQELVQNIIGVMQAKKQIKATEQQTEGVSMMQNQTYVDVIKQRGNIVMLKWNFPTGTSEYSVHSIDTDSCGVNTGSYFDTDKKENCERRFDERSESSTEAAERDFSGFSYLYINGKVLFDSPININKQVQVEQLQAQQSTALPPARLERITSFVREIMLAKDSLGVLQYFGYRNGEQETEGYDTLDELLEQNEKYTRTDITENHMNDYNVCSLYYSDGTVKRLHGNDLGMDFTRMSAGKLKEFADDFTKRNELGIDVLKYQPMTFKYTPHQQKNVTEEQIDIAKNTNLVAFLQQRGYDLQLSGGWYRWKEHPSFAVNEDGRWAWHSQNLKGGPIDFLMKCENMSFVESVEQLSGSTGTYVPNLADNRKENIEQPKPPMKLPPVDPTGSRAKAYLIKTRGLDPQVVKELMNDKLIYESADYHNVVFVGYDKNGTAKYAAQRGTLTNAENPFKRDVLNSDKSYAFQLRGSSATKLAVFEAPIDAISHKCIQKMLGQDYGAVNRIALGGVSDKALEQYLKDNPQITSVAFATDNDEPGQQAAEGLMQKYKSLGYEVSRIMPRAKDFNEDLLVIREEQRAERAQTVQQCPNEDFAVEMELG